jgi:hypothetical protein
MQLIDYQKIADAQKFYSALGFKEINVPWIVQYPAYSATMPLDRKEFYTLGGYLSASGEQGFLELMLSGKKITKNYCITACFRDEPILDQLHQGYFMKLELIDTNATVGNMESMIRISQEFFDSYLPENAKTNIIQIDNIGEAFDIVDGQNGIEPGSYGIRKFGGLKWIYGTGIALPRLDIVLANIK